jgi:hypothetical protein
MSRKNSQKKNYLNPFRITVWEKEDFSIAELKPIRVRQDKKKATTLINYELQNKKHNNSYFILMLLEQ